ncbi:hypothetical protein FHX34_105688 [Actinoplanes teichomyceticus]|uniref:Uncharacterized protein n=1 Tax=Actinoplanes teichomyceticus TaxID=1867 RepID=A0A561VMK0_ACTTI|nr:hypothetical protein FHX34_105688 [Actinoplanes teichomyceticus]
MVLKIDEYCSSPPQAERATILTLFQHLTQVVADTTPR